MKLDIHQIAAVTLGAAQVTEDNGRIWFDRFTPAEGEIARTMGLSRCTAGIQLSFITDASCLRLAVHTEEALPIRSYFSFDVFENGMLLGHIRNFSDEDALCIYPERDFPLGSFSGEFPLQFGESRVDIYFPHSVVGAIEEMELVDATFLTPVKKSRVLLAYGDSITQGFDALHSSRTYAARLAEFLDAELINKGIGGAVFLPALAAAGTQSATHVLIAYGTNDWDLCTEAEFRRNTADFLRTVARSHPEARKTVITPIWRLDHGKTTALGRFPDAEKIIREECAAVAGIEVISGWELVPHEASFFGDGRVHPNDEGFRLYFENLATRL